MPSKRLAVLIASFSVILGSLAITTPLLAASKEKVLYSPCSAENCTDGVQRFIMSDTSRLISNKRPFRKAKADSPGRRGRPARG
jgi:hypothetical protein